MIPFDLIEITDGTTVCTLTDTVSYAIVGYAPRIAARRRSTLGGQGPYEDTSEEITVDVLGDTALNCLENLTRLTRLLNRAYPWSIGADETAQNQATTPPVPVKMRLQVQGSSTTVQCVILESQGPAAAVDPIYDTGSQIWVIPGVSIAFLRRGQLIGGTETASVAAAATPALLGVTFATTTEVAGPLSISLTGLTANDPVSIADGLLILAQHDTDLQILDSPGATAAVGFTVVADAANNAYGGSVLRFTPPDLQQYGPGAFVATTAELLNSRRIAAYAAIRNNSTQSYLVSFQMFDTAGAPGALSTPAVLVDGSTTSPRFFSLGSLSTPNPKTSTGILVQALATGGTLDIDYMIFQSQDIPCNGAIGFNSDDLFTTAVGSAVTLEIEDRILTAPEPFMALLRTANLSYNSLAYSGDIALSSIGSEFALIAMIRNGTRWRLSTTAGVVINLGLTATRRLAYLTPP
jgi:hypothetical protein